MRRPADRRLKLSLALILAAGATIVQPPPRTALAEALAANPHELELTIPYNAVGIDVMPLWTAIDTGAFGRHGIEASAGGAMQSPTIVATMLSGETPFAISGPDAVIGADVNGGDIVMLVSGSEKLLFTIYGSPGIHQITDLRHKIIGVTRFGTTTDFIARYELKAAGLRPDDATLFQMGSEANLLAALLSHRIDAAVLGFDTSLRASQTHSLDRFNVVKDLYDSDLRYYAGSLIAKKSWVDTHRNDTLNVVRAYMEGVAAVRTNKRAALAAFAQYTGTTDIDVLDRSYQALLKKLPEVPVPRASVMQAILDEKRPPNGKMIDARTFVDASFVDELQKDGFIDKLYGR